MRNEHGIEIRECCASCKHKDLTRFVGQILLAASKESEAPGGL